MSALPFAILEPGVYDGIDPIDYHADLVPEQRGGSLSVSGAKLLLPPSCPAKFKEARDHGQPPSPVFDFGHVAHTLVLGEGESIAVLDYKDWRTAAAKAAADEARADGQTPILRHDYDRAEQMAAAVLAHPIAGGLFASHGKAEQSLFWQDDETGVWLRGRTDWIRQPDEGRTVVVDYKTAASADPARFGKAVADFGYHMQHAWYVDGVKALGISDDPGFVFVVQEKTAPFLVSVIQLDDEAVRIGRDLNLQAIDVFVECQSHGHLARLLRRRGNRFAACLVRPLT